ncbi:hypothetical protein OAQ37_07715, partial [Alphaproteobacteria bacterium]|nr:hypothetical protein [Alphaproteobacteria bacterium]
MTFISKRHLMILLALIMLTVAQNAAALVVSEDCRTSDDTDFFELTAFEAAAYVPSLDPEGNPYLKGAALANAEINHYRNEYKDAPLVKMPIDRYAAMTSKNPDALKNFESRLLIIDPECNELKLFFGNLIGTSELSLKNYLQMFDAADRLDHKPLAEFTEQRVRLRPKLISQAIQILKSDLAFDVTVITKTLGDDFLKTMGIQNQSDFAKGGELALLSFAKKGGRIENVGGKTKAFIILPVSNKSLDDTNKTVILLSSGEVHLIASLDTPLTKYALGQLGVPTTILKVNRLFNDNGPVCLLDEVGHWYRMVNGERKRNCNFNQVLIESLKSDGWRMTFDEQSTPISYKQIRDI